MSFTTDKIDSPKSDQENSSRYLMIEPFKNLQTENSLNIVNKIDLT